MTTEAAVAVATHVHRETVGHALAGAPRTAPDLGARVGATREPHRRAFPNQW